MAVTPGVPVAYPTDESNEGAIRANGARDRVNRSMEGKLNVRLRLRACPYIGHLLHMAAGLTANLLI